MGLPGKQAKSNQKLQDSAFVKEYYDEYFEELYKAAYYRLENPHLAEDAVQDTFVCAAKNIDEFRNSPNPAGWLHVVLNHNILHTLRDRDKMLQKMIPLTYEHQDMAAIMPDEISDLDLSGNADLILLDQYYNQGKSLKQLAKTANCTQAAMKMRLQRAKKRLQNDPKIKNLKNFMY